MSFLLELQDLQAQWLAWWLKTPLAKCQQWNQKRDRSVPNRVIESYTASLDKFPPIAAEGFVAINEIKYHQNKLLFDRIPTQIANLTQRQTNYKNRVKNHELHQYSRLLDFERLMYLITLILRYPGIGNLQASEPEILQNIFGDLPQFESDIAEISALMSNNYGKLYADYDALERDLCWLEKNEILTITTNDRELKLVTLETSQFTTHAYSDRESFTRLIETVRFILHNPLPDRVESGSLKTLIVQMQIKGLIKGKYHNSIRKDIEKVLKPYHILPEQPMKKGYFAGTAIFSESELKTLFERLIIPSSRHIEDPVYLNIYQKIKDKIDASKLYENLEKSYPVRAMKDTSIVDTKKLI